MSLPGIGIAVGYVTWIAVLAADLARTGVDVEVLKARFTPSADHRHHQGDRRVATETDAARDRVIAARGDLEDQLHILEASARAAVDIPAKIRRSPAKAAAVVGGAGFLALKGPQRVFRVTKRAVRGPSAAMPDSMLPEEIDKTLRKLGNDGDKVRGSIERDFAKYAKQAARDRTGNRNLLLITFARPIIARAAKAAGEWLFDPEESGFNRRLAELRERAERQAGGKSDDSLPPAV